MPQQTGQGGTITLDGTDVTGAPYSARRDALEKLDLDNGSVRVPPAFDGALTEAVESSRDLGLEGVVAKRTDSTYRVGKRSSAWVKLKHVNAQEAVIVGWRPGGGNRSGTIGSLLLAVPDGSANGADGWRLVDSTHIELLGTTCEMFKTTASAMLIANFPCDVVVE